MTSSALSHRHLKTRITAIVILMLVFACCFAKQSPAARFDEDQVKSAFIYNLANFITWPETSYKHAEAPFVITICKEKQLKPILEKITRQEFIGSHPIKIRYVKSIRHIDSPHILYIPESETRTISAENRIISPGTLTVSNAADFTQKTGAVSLIIKNQKISLVLNRSAIQKAGLKASSKLLQVAIIVDE